MRQSYEIRETRKDERRGKERSHEEERQEDKTLWKKRHEMTEKRQRNIEIETGRERGGKRKAIHQGGPDGTSL